LRSSLIVAALVLCAGPALAFEDASQFFVPMGVTHTATLGASAEGIYFTGAPRWAGLDCSSCHTDGPQKVGLRLAADDPTLFTSGYVPGQTYELEVAISHETEGLSYSTPTCTDPPQQGDTYTYEQCNANSFALEVDSIDVPLAGPNVFCAAPPSGGCPKPDASTDEVVIAPGNDAVFANHAHSTTTVYEVVHNDETSWHVWWTAPPAGAGPLTFYIAAVDGNGGAGNANDDQDPYGDDTVREVVDVKERGSSGSLDARAGCAAVPSPLGAADALLVMFALGWLLRRRAKGRR
jgi:uncharacterized protein (TIGR03382 family)